MVLNCPSLTIAVKCAGEGSDFYTTDDGKGSDIEFEEGGEELPEE